MKIKMLPLSFHEFLDFYGFEIREMRNVFENVHKQIFDKDGECYELREVFDAYMSFGGMSGLVDVGFDQERALSLLDGFYSTVVIRDILEKEKHRAKTRLQIRFCSIKSFFFLRIISVPIFQSVPSEIP